MDEMEESLREIGSVYSKPIQAGREITEFLMSFRSNNRQYEKLTGDSYPKKDLDNFVFTGKETDLCYFNNSDKLPLSAIANIQDDALKKKVVDVFDRMNYKGLVEFDGQNISLTEKGKEKLADKNFQKQAAVNQQKAFTAAMFPETENTQLCTTLTGDCLNDFTFFNLSDKLDLNTIAGCPDAELSKRALSNVKIWKDCGIVDVKDNTAFVTAKGRELLANPKFRTATVQLPENALSSVAGVTGKIVVATKQVMEQAVQSLKKSVHLSK